MAVAATSSTVTEVRVAARTPRAVHGGRRVRGGAEGRKGDRPGAGGGQRVHGTVRGAHLGDTAVLVEADPRAGRGAGGGVVVLEQLDGAVRTDDDEHLQVAAVDAGGPRVRVGLPVQPPGINAVGLQAAMQDVEIGGQELPVGDVERDRLAPCRRGPPPPARSATPSG